MATRFYGDKSPHLVSLLALAILLLGGGIGCNTSITIGKAQPDDASKERPMVEKPLNDGKSFIVRTPRGDAAERFSVVIYLAIRKTDELKFDKRYAQCTREINDSIYAVLVASTIAERQEVGLISIKEKVKRAVNDVLGTPWVTQVLCTEISLEVQ